MLSRHSPLALARGLTARNRIVIPPMASGTGTPDGAASAATVAHYAKLAGARAGLTFVEYTYVHSSGRSEERQLGLASAAHAAALEPVVAALKASGTIAGIQLTHAGAKTERALTGGFSMAPGAVAPPVKDRILETPDPMTAAEISMWTGWFVQAAARAAAVGFEIVELHAAHGYGLNQWLSPLTNQRTDGYGGVRLLVEIVRAVRAAVPQVLLAVRMPGRDFLDGGLTQADALGVARELVDAGVGLIDVSSGLGGWRRPPERRGEGYLVPEAAFIQRGVGVPVIGVGGIESGAYIDRALNDRHLALAAVGRAILRDPVGWWDAQMISVPPRVSSRVAEH